MSIMRYVKIFVILLISFWVFVYIPKEIRAFDYEIRCTNKNCTNFPSNVFFTSKTNWFPGMWEKKVVRVTSTAPDAILVRNSLRAFVPDTSSCKIHDKYILSISVNGKSPTQSVVWAGSLNDLSGASASPPYIAYIVPKSYVELTYLVSLPENVGNECQGKSVDFKLNLIFASSAYVPPKNKLTPTLGPDSLPPCTQTPPKTAPVISLSSIESDRVTINISGKPQSSFTYYMLAYGLKGGDYTFGNPNIGGADTTSYTVIGLTPNQSYLFAVRAVNGCAPGPFSDEVGVNVPTKIPTPSPTGTVLGATARPRAPTPTRTKTPTPTPTIAAPGSPLYNYLYVPLFISIFIVAIVIVK